jgi:hypothetical protein
MKGGTDIDMSKFSFSQNVRLQANIMKTQMALEDTFVDIAMNEEKPSVIICDRGLMDGPAYIPQEIWQTVLDQYNWSHI